MPPKQAASNKSVKKAQDKVIEDKTFGLKNKNKSKAVQKFCADVAQNVKSGGGPEAKRKAAEAAARNAAKEDKIAREASLAMLFKQVATEKKEVDPSIGPNGEVMVKTFDEVTGEYLWQPEDFGEVEHDDRRLEEQLEDELAVIRARPASELTRCTEASIAVWKAQKKKDADDAREKELRRIMREYEKKGHGISGRKLWSHDATLFVDDDDAAGGDEYAAEEEEEIAEPTPAVAVDGSLFAGDDLPEDDEDEEEQS